MCIPLRVLMGLYEMKSTKIILVLLQLYYLHVNAIRLHETTNEATTSAAPIAATTPMTNVSVVDDDDETVGNTTNAVNTTEFVKTESKSIKNDWPTRKSKPDLIVIKKKKLVTKQISSSFSNDKINVPQSNAGPSPENDESKETNNFVPSPELSEEYSHELVTHDTYPGSDFSENNPLNFVPSTNPLIITQLTNAPVIANVQHKYHSHVDKLPIWPYPYENIDNKFKWKILSNEHKHNDNGKVLFPTEVTTVSGKSTTYTNYPSKNTSPAHNFYRHPFAYDAPVSSQVNFIPTPFSYTTITTDGDIQDAEIEPTPDNRLPPWMEIHHIPNDAYDSAKAPIEYYAKAMEKQPNQQLINDRPHYTLTHIDKNVLWHSVFKFLATAVPIGLVISALSPNVVTVRADSPPRLNTTFSRINNTTRYPNPMAAASILMPIDEDC